MSTRAPAAGQGMIVDAARDAFMHGWTTACLVAAAVAVVGSFVALAFLPNRGTTPADVSAAA
ncbi:MAG: hypothetical protein FGM42_09390 [Ilumatobacteraceae bacterium]|nr:hypothetical protein [Ilumatobacteraceae bacterium]